MTHSKKILDLVNKIKEIKNAEEELEVISGSLGVKRSLSFLYNLPENKQRNEAKYR